LFFFFSFESILRKKLDEEFGDVVVVVLGDVESIFCDVVDDIIVLLIMMMIMLLLMIILFLLQIKVLVEI
jgi:uncharacterized membrane protein